MQSTVWTLDEVKLLPIGAAIQNIDFSVCVIDRNLFHLISLNIQKVTLREK